MILPTKKTNAEQRVAIYGGLGTTIAFITIGYFGLTFFEIPAFEAFFILAQLTFATVFFCWLLYYQTLIRRRQRNEHNRRSAWGERRTDEPTPYKERLACFVSAAGELTPAEDSASREDLTSVGDPIFRSQMTFWTAVDVPCESEPPKPEWFIRRVLRRIQEALVGYHQ